MSSKFKVLSIVLAALMALAFYSATTKADVTGSFGIHLSFNPIQCQYLSDGAYFNIIGFPDQPCEKTFFKIDFETALDVNITISGLTMGIHSHTGVTGFEDIILSFATTLGALDISDIFVFAMPFGLVTLPDGEKIPTCYASAPGQTPGTVSCLTLFVKKRVEATISLGGVTFSNLAIFEDVNFPSPTVAKPTDGYYNQDLQAFGFGDVITVSGQTPSGITVTSETGICAQQAWNMIKKHKWYYTVNPECAQPALASKPPLLFDFEKLYIEGIPLAAGLTLDMAIECIMPTGPVCGFTGTWNITGFPWFDLIQVSTGIDGLPLGAAGTSFSDITVKAAGGPLSLTLVISPATMTITKWSAVSSFTINPDTNPASLKITAKGAPGINALGVVLSISRAGLTFSSALDYSVSAATQTFNFDKLTFGLKAQAGVVTTSASVIIKDMGREPEEAFMLGGTLDFVVAF